MAVTLIPSINAVSDRMTPGEHRFAERLLSKLEPETLCWYDVPIGDKRLHPDFILFHPSRGMLILEVKDWKLTTLLKINKERVILQTEDGPVHQANPLEQARHYSHAVVNLLKKDPQLIQKQGDYAGNLLFPYGIGVVLSNITRKEFDSQRLSEVLPAAQVICKDEFFESVPDEKFREQLWGMREVHFPCAITLPQVNRIRWHIFPDIRIETQIDFFDRISIQDGNDPIRVMDLKQEEFARSMGEGHRVIHGVAGSGKTMILLHRAEFLSRMVDKPVLVVCYNKALRAHLEQQLLKRDVSSDKIEVKNFHAWCHGQLQKWRIPSPEGSGALFCQRLVERVATGIAKGTIPTEQYGAVLIDEGHDMEKEWLSLLTQMPTAPSRNLLLLYDDAQSIYLEEKKRTFHFSEVGIEARGRTTILRTNYRNGREIFYAASRFAEELLKERSAEDDQVPTLHPEGAGRNGMIPHINRRKSPREEAQKIVQQIKDLKELKPHGIPLEEIAIIYRQKGAIKSIEETLKEEQIPYQRQSSNSQSERKGVQIYTIQSSKGLEFPYVFLPSFGQPFSNEGSLEEEERFYYVAATRATCALEISYFDDNPLAEKMEKVLNERKE